MKLLYCCAHLLYFDLLSLWRRSLAFLVDAGLERKLWHFFLLGSSYFFEVHQVKEVVLQVLPLEFKAHLFDKGNKFVQTDLAWESALHFGDLKGSALFQNSVCFMQESSEVGAHQGETENGHVHRWVVQRGSEKVITNNKKTLATRGRLTTM